AVRLAVQALQGLEAVHATGVIHRDLSPDNLMITEDKGGNLRMKIIDLGLARTLEADANFEITQVGMFMGKLQYCSPEQASPAGAFIAALEQVESGLTDVQTKEIPKELLAEARRSAPPPPRQRSSGELSKAERVDLLAQIERASKRVQESSGELARAEATLAAGRLDEAAELILRIEIAAPRTQGLERLKDRLAQARERVTRAHRAA